MSYLPSKKFIATLGIGIGAVLLSYGAWHIQKFFFNTASFFRPTSTKTAQNTLGAYERFSQDTDRDGLKDWEEIIWSTNAKNPDTDGDGTADGDEVKQNRDPLKPAPNDQLSQAQIDGSGQKTRTLSEELAHNIDIRYFTQKAFSNNEPLTADQKNNIAAAFVSDIDAQLSSYGDIYTKSDLNIVPSESMRSYGNKLGSFLATTFNGLSGYELQILDTASKSGNMQTLNQLDPYIAGYTSAIVFAKRQAVPPAMADGHLIFINTLNNLKIADEKMKLLGTDGATALIGARLFARETTRLIDFLKILQTQLNTSRTAFDTSEPGALFYKYFEIQLKNNP